jgi:hypothetical protein
MKVFRNTGWRIAQNCIARVTVAFGAWPRSRKKVFHTAQKYHYVMIKSLRNDVWYTRHSRVLRFTRSLYFPLRFLSCQHNQCVLLLPVPFAPFVSIRYGKLMVVGSSTQNTYNAGPVRDARHGVGAPSTLRVSFNAVYYNR